METEQKDDVLWSFTLFTEYLIADNEAMELPSSVIRFFLCLDVFNFVEIYF